MGVKHYKTDGYLIEQYNENTAVILLEKPFDKEFNTNTFKRQISAVLRPILANSEHLYTKHLIFIDKPEYNPYQKRKQNNIKIEIHFIFKQKLKFKDKVKYLEENVIKNILKLV